MESLSVCQWRILDTKLYVFYEIAALNIEMVSVANILNYAGLTYTVILRWRICEAEATSLVSLFTF